ncbi:MAG: hypothetical protein M1816_005736 [Peltula sp. TS41687]|nr:MAG: hypothetical protein M1816_005736 [Peltula sp. TS41687]
MQACDNMLSTNFLGASAGNGPNPAMYGQSPQYAPYPGPGLPYGLLHGLPHGIPHGLPPNPSVQTNAHQASMNALNQTFNSLSIHDGVNTGPGPIPNPQLNMTAGHGGIQEPYFLIRDGIVYARADIAPYAYMQGQGNVPGMPGRLMPRNMQPQGQTGFMGNVAYVPVAPPPPPFVPRGDGAGREPPPFNENQISTGSHSDDPSSPETPNTVVANQLHPKVAIAGADVASAAPYYHHRTPSPRHYLNSLEPAQLAKAYGIQKLAPDLFTVAGNNPAIPRAVPAVLGARKTLHECFENPTGTTNVYIRGLHPETTDDMLHAYAARFGHVANSKAMIDSQTGACKGYGFACFQTIQEAQNCIRGFYYLGYEVSFARESFNARLKSFSDPTSTNLYVSNLPRSMTETELEAIFEEHKVLSSRIIRDAKQNSKGVGFARFSTRAECDEIIKKYHGQPIGQEQLLLQVRYADTPEQKRLKHETQRRREFRANEYNAMAYGCSAMFPFQPIRSGLGIPVPTPIHLQRDDGTWIGHSVPPTLVDARVTNSVPEATLTKGNQHVQKTRQARVDYEIQASGSDSNESASVSPTSPTIAYGDNYSSVVTSALVPSA